MTKTVKEIFEMIENNKLHYDQTTQRQFIYMEEITTDDGNITRAGNVIRSILFYHIQLPALFFWQIGKNEYNIHDGKQRILSLYYFCHPNNDQDIKVTTRLDSGEVDWNLLTDKQQKELLNYKFEITVKNGDKDLEEKSFDLINTNSVPLTEYECIRGLNYGRWLKEFEEYLTNLGRTNDYIPSQIKRGDKVIDFLYFYWERYSTEKGVGKSIRTTIRPLRDNHFDPNVNNFEERLKKYNELKCIKVFAKVKPTIVLQIVDYIFNHSFNFRKVWNYYNNGSNNPKNDIANWQIETHKTAIYRLCVNGIECDTKRFFSKEERGELISKDNSKCVECGETNKLLLEVDHITPWSKGGKTEFSNAQLLCKSCNASKGNRQKEELINENIIV